ncbi:MAG: B12-binding domain-containing radical SAM protein [Firmicutes bacterium]|nr:B12-binding domain-containing radical SAM protein [Bacillota bacterium]
MPNLGLGYLATAARNKGHEVSILNCPKEHFNYGDFRKFMEHQPFDMAGFQCFSYDVPSVARHISIAREVNPGIITVVGGPHPSGDPDGVLEHLTGADFAFQSDSEISFPIFLEAIEKKDTGASVLGRIPGIIFRDNGEIKIIPPQRVENLDDLGFPAWDLMKPAEYPPAPHGGFVKNFPTAPVIITRGCPYKCTFCAGKTIAGAIPRKRSLAHVFEELELLKSRYGVKEINIEDENFTLHKPMAKEFCRKLIENKMNLSWTLPSGVRLDSLDEELLSLMEASGCYSLAVGIESGSQRVLDLIKKGLTIELIKEKVRLIKKTSIKITGFFMIGYPGETVEEIKNTVDFALELGISRAHFAIFTPVPGSEAYEELKKEGKLAGLKWEKLYFHDIGFEPPGFTAKNLKKLQRYAYLKFYLNPRILLPLLGEVKSLSHLRFLLMRFREAAGI